MRTRQGETICLGFRIRPASAVFPPAGGVWGGMRAGFGLGGFGNSAALRKKWKVVIIDLQVIKVLYHIPYIIIYYVHNRQEHQKI